MSAFLVHALIRATCRLLWRFAIRVVLQDLEHRRRWLTLPDLSRRRQQRLKYQQLYLQRMDKQTNGKEAGEVSCASYEASPRAPFLAVVPTLQCHNQ